MNEFLKIVNRKVCYTRESIITDGDCTGPMVMNKVHFAKVHVIHVGRLDIHGRLAEAFSAHAVPGLGTIIFGVAPFKG